MFVYLGHLTKHSFRFPVVVHVTIRVCLIGHASQRDTRIAQSITHLSLNIVSHLSQKLLFDSLAKRTLSDTPRSGQHPWHPLCIPLLLSSCPATILSAVPFPETVLHLVWLFPLLCRRRGRPPRVYCVSYGPPCPMLCLWRCPCRLLRVSPDPWPSWAPTLALAAAVVVLLPAPCTV